MVQSSNRESQQSSPHDAKSALQESLANLAGTFAHRAVSSASDRLSGASERLTDYAQNGGGGGLLAAVTGVDKLASGSSPLKAAMGTGLAGAKETVKDTLTNVKDSLLGGKGKGAGKKLKLTNITEDIDVGAPLDLVYRQWTEYAQFPGFMKKVEQADQTADEKVQWKAQVFWSHRSWEATIVEQVPFDHIVWRSKGAKGHIDGAVSFHELAPNLTRIVVVLEYHPKGLFERTGTLWRAQGRRARLELKHFRRHVMTQTVLHPDDVEGWLGEIRDSKVVDTGENGDVGENGETGENGDTGENGEVDETDETAESKESESKESEDTDIKERQRSSSSTRRRTADGSSSRRGGNGERQSRRTSATKKKEESHS